MSPFQSVPTLSLLRVLQEQHAVLDSSIQHNKRGMLMMAEFHKGASVSGSHDCSLSCLMVGVH